MTVSIDFSQTLLSVYCLFYYVVWLDFILVSFTFVNQFLPMDWLWEWFMFLTLFIRLTHVNVLHWVIRLYIYVVLVNKGIGLILVIQIFCPSSLSVLYSKDVYPTSSIVWSTICPFMYWNHIMLYKTLLYNFNNQCFFTLLILWFIYIYVRYYVFIYYYCYHPLSALYIFIIPSSFYTNHTT